MTSHRLDRIKIRSVGRQPFDVGPPRAALAQSPNGRSVHVQLIEHDDQGAAVMPVQLAQIAQYVGCANVAHLDSEVRLESPSRRRQAQAVDDAQPIVALRNLLLWARTDRGTQVRWFSGCRRKPVSSENTSVECRRRAFF